MWSLYPLNTAHTVNRLNAPVVETIFPSMNRDHTLLVTVGTTGFDDLIAEVCSEGVVRELVKQGFDSIIVQYGSSKSVYSEANFEKYNVFAKTTISHP